VTTIVLAASLTACGGGGEESTSTSAEQAQVDATAEAHSAEVKREHQQRKAAEAQTPEEQQAEETASDFYAILGEDEAEQDPNKTTIDSESFCELMSEQARQQTIHYAKVSSGIAQEWDCESAVELLVLRAKRTGGFEGSRQAEVIGVNAEGDEATATIRFGPEGAATSVPLVKEDGEWKLGANAVPAGQ
jgi:hypothetical protein